MSRTKLFVKNFLVYGFGGIISKAIPLIMVPIITRLMPNSFYYGMSDLSNTIVSLFSALALMGMYDAMYRMFFEKDDDNFKKDICSSALAFTIIASTVVSIIMIALQKPISQLFYTDSSYGNLVMLCAASVLIGGTNSIIAAPTRMENKKITFLITNSLSPIVSYSIAIPLIINGHYLIALPLSMLISALTLEIAFMILNRKWFSFKRINWKYIKSMLVIALPLLPNFIIYWVFNSSDRVMISNLIGPDASGVYAVAAKIGQVSQLIYLAFAGGWQYFAFSIMRDKDNVQVLSKIFEILAALSFITTLLGTSICKWGVQLLFEEEYWTCYLCIPYLYLAPLLLMLFQIGSNQFLVIKKTWPNMLILGLGAILNIALNFFLIPIIGIEGASLATFVGYFIAISACLLVLLKLKLIEVGWKFLSNVVIFISFFSIMRINTLSLYYINIPLALIFLVYNYVLYRRDVKLFICRLFKRTNSDKYSVGGEENSNKVGKKGIIIGIQILRIIAILMIFISHCNIFMNENGDNSLQYLGSFGVSIFIVISGFLLMHGRGEPLLCFKDYLKYVCKKLKKFYPLHIFLLLLSIPLYIKLFNQDTSGFFYRFISNLLLFQSFIPIKDFYFSFNMVAWYLSLNLFFILIGPFIKRAFKDLEYKFCIPLMTILILIEYMLYSTFKDCSIGHWILYIFPITRLVDFIFGILLYIFITNSEMSKLTKKNKLIISISSFIFSALMTALISYLSWTSNDYIFLSFSWLLPSALLVACFYFLPVCSRKRARLFVFFGNITFDFFMWHLLIIRYDEWIFNRIHIDIRISYIISFIISVVVAIMSSFLSKKINDLCTKK